MPNPFHFRANIDRLWRRANSNAPTFRRLNSLDAIVRELYAPNDRARRNYQLYLATDPFDVARHLLRDLHDRPGPLLPDGVLLCSPPALRGEMPQAEGGPLLPDEAQLDEDDDPL